MQGRRRPHHLGRHDHTSRGRQSGPAGRLEGQCRVIGGRRKGHRFASRDDVIAAQLRNGHRSVATLHADHAAGVVRSPTPSSTTAGHRPSTAGRHTRSIDPRISLELSLRLLRGRPTGSWAARRRLRGLAARCNRPRSSPSGVVARSRAAGEALLIAVVGRPVVVNELAGDDLAGLTACLETSLTVSPPGPFDPAGRLSCSTQPVKRAVGSSRTTSCSTRSTGSPMTLSSAPSMRARRMPRRRPGWRSHRPCRDGSPVATYASISSKDRSSEPHVEVTCDRGVGDGRSS